MAATLPSAGEAAVDVVVRLHVVRHAESVGNVEHKLHGTTDSPLTPHGHRQAAAVAAHLASVQFHEAYTSPLSRARDTAAAIVAAQTARHGGTLTAVEDRRLLERAFGALEGRKYNEPLPPLGKPPETMRAVYDRAASVLNKLVTRHLRSDGQAAPAVRNILIVSHGILLQALIKAALAAGRRDGVDPDLTQFTPMHANAAYTVLELRPVAGTLHGLTVSVVVENERSHLAALPKPPRALAVAAVAPGQKTLASAWGLQQPAKRSKPDEPT